MSVKYYCDICGKESGTIKANFSAIDNKFINLSDMDMCENCAKELNTRISIAIKNMLKEKKST